MKFLDGNPFALCFSVEIVTVKNLQREFEVGESLSERADKLVNFNSHSHLFLDVIS